MARAKRPSDELYNARRRAKRQMERLERQGDKIGAARLRGAIRESYGRSDFEMAAAELASTSRLVPSGKQEVTQKLIEPTIATTSTSQGVSGKLPRKKRPSDELYNARRRLRREADALERNAAGVSGAERDAILGYAKYLREQARPTGKLDVESRMKAFERLQRLREESRESVYGTDRTLRRNVIFKQQMNAAGTEGADSSISERKKDVFWMATKGLWPKGSSVPRNERYERIIDHFYRDNTTDARAFRAWLEERGADVDAAYGDLQWIYEYITEVMNDPRLYDMPEMPYQDIANIVRMAM